MADADPGHSRLAVVAGPDSSTVPFFENGADRAIPWGYMKLLFALVSDPGLLSQIGSSLPLMLTFLRRAPAGGGNSAPNKYAELAMELGLGVSTLKRQAGHLEEMGLIKKTPQGQTGFEVEFVHPVFDDETPIDILRHRIQGLERSLDALGVVLNQSLAETRRNLLNTLEEGL